MAKRQEREFRLFNIFDKKKPLDLRINLHRSSLTETRLYLQEIRYWHRLLKNRAQNRSRPDCVNCPLSLLLTSRF